MNLQIRFLNCLWCHPQPLYLHLLVLLIHQIHRLQLPSYSHFDHFSSQKCAKVKACSHHYCKFDDLLDQVMSIAIQVVARFDVALMMDVFSFDQSNGHRNYVDQGSQRVVASKTDCSVRSQTEKLVLELISAKNLVKLVWQMSAIEQSIGCTASLRFLEASLYLLLGESLVEKIYSLQLSYQVLRS